MSTKSKLSNSVTLRTVRGGVEVIAAPRFAEFAKSVIDEPPAYTEVTRGVVTIWGVGRRVAYRLRAQSLREMERGVVTGEKVFDDLDAKEPA